MAQHRNGKYFQPMLPSQVVLLFLLQDGVQQQSLFVLGMCKQSFLAPPQLVWQVRHMTHLVEEQLQLKWSIVGIHSETSLLLLQRRVHPINQNHIQAIGHQILVLAWLPL